MVFTTPTSNSISDLSRLAVSPIPVHDYSSLLFPPVAEKSRQVYEEYVQVDICIIKTYQLTWTVFKES
jgi:hypothetical protein